MARYMMCFQVNVTGEQFDTLIEEASQLGMPLSKYIRGILFPEEDGPEDL